MQTSQLNNNGCTTIISFYVAREAASISSSDDVIPTTSSTDSTEKSEVDLSGNNTIAAKKGKYECYVVFAVFFVELFIIAFEFLDWIFKNLQVCFWTFWLIRSIGLFACNAKLLSNKVMIDYSKW